VGASYAPSVTHCRNVVGNAVRLLRLNAWQAGEIGYDEGLLSQRTFNLFYRDANIFINQAKEAGTLALWKQTLDENPDWTDSIVFQHLYDLISNAESID